MSREILSMANALANEKNVSPDVVFATVEAALLSAGTKFFSGKNVDLIVKIDQQLGRCEVIRRWLVVPDSAGLQEPDREILFFEAEEQVPGIKIGEYIEEVLDIRLFGRIGANASKHVIVQGTRDAARIQDYEDYMRSGRKIMAGTIKRFEKGNIIIDAGRVEGILRSDQVIPKESLRVGDRIRAYIMSGDFKARGPQLELSRIAPEFLEALFELEIPEIDKGMLNIKGIARDPGFRSKIAVYTEDSMLDPIGTCVGIRGSRIQAIRNELNGENIDILLWSEDPAQFVIAALAPAEVLSIVVDEDRHTMEVVVDELQRAVAIGRNGQNVDLASRLTGWKIDIITFNESASRQDEERQRLHNIFITLLDVDSEVADVLIEAGFSSIEEVAYVPIDEILAIEALDAETIHELRSRARIALVKEEESVTNHQLGCDDLLDVFGMTPEYVKKLLQAGVKNRNDLADLSAVELRDIIDIDELTATSIILKAREHLF